LIFFASLNKIVNCTPDVEWVNSKYHDTGAHWGVFGGIVIFMVMFQLMGIAVEVWYKNKLSTFLESNNIGDTENQINNY